MIELNTSNYDAVIDSHYLTGFTNYQTAIEELYPLINRLDIQRKTQNESFYKRLEKDLEDGCIMPPLTIAFIEKNDVADYTQSKFKTYISKNISKGFILDGIQRLNTLQRVHKKKSLDLNRPLFLNIIICKKRDNLLYRMVTLNNGQKPMTARHQIEILASNLYNFSDYGLNVLTEKEAANKKPKGSFKKADLISAYIAYLSNTTNLDNTKIIESKMDELIARKIMESNITSNQDISFSDVLTEIARLTKLDVADKWLRNVNNLVGFSVGIKKSLKKIQNTSIDVFSESINAFEDAFDNFDVSKIKLSRERRKLSQYFIENYSELNDYNADDLLLAFNEID